ncbi:hypothetical protein T07_13857, partial [Trichinella nelsoni]
MCEDMLGKNLALMMDSRVRWNCMLTMLRRFLEMKDCVKSALKSLSDVDNFLSETELTLISDIVNALEPVALCQQLKLFLNFCCEILKSKEATLPKKTKNTSLCSLLCTLIILQATFPHQVQAAYLTRLNKRDIKATAKDLFDRMFKIQEKETKDINGNGDNSEKNAILI